MRHIWAVISVRLRVTWSAPGSRSARVRGPPGCSSHYPSWGFETREARRGRLSRLACLITPHGDSKPFTQRRTSCPRCRTSLPLMGIRNLFLTTLQSTGIDSHYPSWGFETLSHSPGMHQPLAKLITPHGDSKQARAPESLFETSAHYPSWGFELGVGQRADRDRRDSLPLMGIRNELALKLWQMLARSSLPLMGIRNPSPAARQHRAPTSHYPSWGFETTLRDRCRRRPSRLITPHGDSKQDVAVASSP